MSGQRDLSVEILMELREQTRFLQDIAGILRLFFYLGLIAMATAAILLTIVYTWLRTVLMLVYPNLF